MDISSRFFTKLRNLGVSLETETASLQHAHQHFDKDGSTEGAVRLLQELHSEIRNLKGEVGGLIARQQAKETETRSFIKACLVLKQRSTEDILRLQRHYEQYGYQVPGQAHTGSENACEESETPPSREEGGGGAEGREEELQDDLLPVTPVKVPLPAGDPMRTPQLSDFGLSEIHLKKALGGTGFPGDAAHTPVMSLPPPSLVMQPPMPKTPKCTLSMDEDDPLTPRMEDFGITEHTMCLNNDFTMDLRRKQPSKTISSAVTSDLESRTSQVLPAGPPNSGSHGLASTVRSPASMESPETPVFCTPGFTGSSPQRGQTDARATRFPGNRQATPEVPAFETPYISRLLSTRKADRERDDPDEACLSGGPAPHRAGEYEVPGGSRGCSDEKHSPEMPSLESLKGSSPPCRGTGLGGALPECRMGSGEPPSPGTLELDCPTQEFSLGSPRVRGGYPDPSTPPMPDLSSVTQDICKLVSQMKKPSTASLQTHTKHTGKENRGAQALAMVSEGEFLSLPSYLRQMPLAVLNQAVLNINTTVERQLCGADGGTAVFLMEDLKKVTDLGTKTPLCFLCLTELRRLEHVQGTGPSSMYRVPRHT